VSTSFRFTPDEELHLRKLARQLGKTKTEVMRMALMRFSAEQAENPNGSVLSNLLAAGFKPLPMNIGDIAHDEEKQRQFIRNKLRKKYRA
jgi:hypothetical protein